MLRYCEPERLAFKPRQRVSAWHQKVKLQTYPSKPTTEVKKEPTEANVNMEEEPVDDFMNVEGPWPDTDDGY